MSDKPKTIETAEKLIDIIPRMMQMIVFASKNLPNQLPMNHYRILHILDKNPMSLSRLAARLMISKASLSETIQVLYSKGWIQKEKDSGDARITILKTSPLGLEQLQMTEKEFVKFIGSRLAELEPVELLKIEQGLDIISRRVITTHSRRDV